MNEKDLTIRLDTQAKIIKKQDKKLQKLNKLLKEKNKEIEELVKAEEESCLEKNLTIENLEKQLEDAKDGLERHASQEKYYKEQLEEERGKVKDKDKVIQERQDQLAEFMQNCSEGNCVTHDDLKKEREDKKDLEERLEAHKSVAIKLDGVGSRAELIIASKDKDIAAQSNQISIHLDTINTLEKRENDLEEKVKKYEDAFRDACPHPICPDDHECVNCPVYPGLPKEPVEGGKE